MTKTFALFTVALLWCGSALYGQTVAVTEVQNSSGRPGTQQSDAYPSRVTFYRIPTGQPLGSVETIEFPSVTTAPGKDTFLVASANIAFWGPGEKKTIISEFDPRLKKVVDTYEHPRSIGGGAAPIFFGLSYPPSSMQCTGGLVWLRTIDDPAKPETGKSYIEGLNWKQKKVVATLELPAAKDQVYSRFFAMGEQCVVIRMLRRNHPDEKTDLILVWEGGHTDPIVVSLPPDQSLRDVAVGKSQLVARLGLSSKLVRIDVDQAKHKFTIGEPVDVPELKEGGRYIDQLLYLGDGHLVVTARAEDKGVDRLFLLDAATLKLERTVELHPVVDGVRYQGGVLYGYAPDMGIVIEYDKDFKIQRETGIGWRMIGFTPWS